jgi:hypothetical protein
MSRITSHHRDASPDGSYGTPSLCRRDDSDVPVVGSPCGTAIAARSGERLMAHSTISGMTNDDPDQLEPPSAAQAITALFREARSLSRRADKLGSTAAAVDDPTTQQLAAQACTSMEQLVTTSWWPNARHSAARSQQLGGGSDVARSGVVVLTGVGIAHRAAASARSGVEPGWSGSGCRSYCSSSAAPHGSSSAAPSHPSRLSAARSPRSPGPSCTAASPTRPATTRSPGWPGP